MKSRIASFFGNNVKAFSVAVRTMITAVLLAVITIGCTFTGTPETTQSGTVPAETNSPVAEPSSIPPATTLPLLQVCR